MKNYIVEGTLINADLINDGIMKEHMAYTQKAMDEGLILMSGLKADNSGGIFIIKAESLEKLEEYLNNEPFKVNGIQGYRVIEFSPHYFNKTHNQWFNL